MTTTGTGAAAGIAAISGGADERPWRRWSTLGAVLGLLHWFFGNLYEAVVISPNWVVESPAQLTRLNDFFARTSPTLYFVPVLVVAVALTWWLWATARGSVAATAYRRAGWLAVVAMAVNTVVVVTVVSVLFGDEATRADADLTAYAWRWNVLNVVRMVLVAATAVQLFEAFRRLDRAAEPAQT
ncbi:MAG: hypothetical protein S0880_08360 [Actinomycetota bacterium]|nr:hypothetical protein [Actinomycetota bacterium]